MSGGKTVYDQAVDVNASANASAPDEADITPAQRRWLVRGLTQPGGKLPLFDHNGRRVSGGMVRRCIDKGLAEPWFANPIKPDWLVCKLTPKGRATLEALGATPESEEAPE